MTQQHPSKVKESSLGVQGSTGVSPPREDLGAKRSEQRQQLEHRSPGGHKGPVGLRVSEAGGG